MVDRRADQIATHLCFIDLLHAISDNQAPFDWHNETAERSRQAERWFKQRGNYPRWEQWRLTRQYHEKEADRLLDLRQRDLI